MKQAVIGILVVFAALWVLVPQALFTIDEREQAIITQFGAYIRT
jgi:regulator of protease activity HflC (stomatin/prohibitin superfamily)